MQRRKVDLQKIGSGGGLAIGAVILALVFVLIAAKGIHGINRAARALNVAAPAIYDANGNPQPGIRRHVD